ncbi:MAG: hypothetical protein J6Y17_02255 [Elusimicrobiaceae bacterium]|nr:hypothetical protein [Elusimicrobiaceae bacterium]
MQEKLKQLELLITQTLTRQKELAGENASLKNRLRNLEQSNLELKDLQTQLRELKEWKKNTQNVLRRLAARVDKELEKAKEEQNKIV